MLPLLTFNDLVNRRNGYAKLCGNLSTALTPSFHFSDLLNILGGQFGKWSLFSPGETL